MNEGVKFYDEGFYDSQADGSLRSANEILRLLWKIYSPSSVVDFGCGKGTWLYAAEILGVKRLKGFDGDWAKDGIISKNIDFATCNLEELNVKEEKYDLAISVEVAEHLKRGSEKNFIKNLCHASDVIIFSAAIPNQGGTNHINENPQSFWIKLFKEEGFDCFDYFRPLIWKNDTIEWWYRQNIFLFIRQGESIPFDLKMIESQKEGIYDIVHPVIYEYRFQQFADASRKVEDRDKEIASMRKSKFWKLRDVYLKFKNVFKNK